MVVEVVDDVVIIVVVVVMVVVVIVVVVGQSFGLETSLPSGQIYTLSSIQPENKKTERSNK